MMRGQPQVYEILKELNIPFDYYEHPPVPTVKEAAIYWKDIEAAHCKNLFFRNHKGNKHFLVLLEFYQNLDIKSLEARLKQGKISFASDERLMKHLGLTAGSVSPFGLINDKASHVHVFIDEKLQHAKKISFHPNINTASIVLSFADFMKYLNSTGNSYTFLKLY
ncbi:MAG: prolyl-tRNA synthetase associated domain-containing protein [Bacteroidetes bacterium]|nr:prolyl-tRNA synthetase associated domain-containing protein [Bacteroidota bacterium]